MSHNRMMIVGASGALLALLILDPAFASTSGGGNLPWESPLQQIQQSITGPVAGFIALAAVAVAGGMLIFGGELNDFARRLMYVVLVAGILLGATQIVALFGASGASIGDVAPTAPAGDLGHG
ncbi:TrbC/VirB2 family protein (plasmid) [Bradyrhizobium barranii subsp. barranii]|uniref:TrbC/VirB2 family protein n=1 Tax=Bradyrhizobium barranii subsp. barranii TaxID=2823807 RepID=A0A7Z0QL24_9BRAD|nr:TrbC/VirB2 family protein [Bradyrhizobium barranii]UGX99502.1 TrbC/VirB2 family protein [Bradyrhizobium barranii subsp. barranii]